MATSEELAARILNDLPAMAPGRLPTLRSLAARYEASTRTVHSALERLRAMGRIESRPRSGHWRVGDLPGPLRKERRETCQDLGERLCREIREGVHPFDSPLPSLKELSQRWNCHAQTAAKAMEIPVRAGLVVRRGRLHFPAQPKARRQRASRPTILCIGSAGDDGGFEIEFERESDFWRELGAAAAFSGIALQRMSWKHCDAEGTQIPVGPSVLGVVASTWHLCDPVALYQALARVRVPVCIWVESPSVRLREGLCSRFHFHDQGYGPAIGAQVARHLLELGHRHIAYVSPWHGGDWSRNRLAGIQKEVASRDALLDVFANDEAEEVAYFGRARVDPVFTGNFPERALEKILPEGVGALREFAARELGWSRIRRDAGMLLEKALASRASAWICANDATALIARTWLRKRGLGVPEDVSIAGFDDTTEALRADLTTLRFGSSPMARSMVLQILSGSRKGSLTRHEGAVIARASTRPWTGSCPPRLPPGASPHPPCGSTPSVMDRK